MHFKNQTIDEPLQNLQSLQQQCLFRTCQKCGCNEYDGVCFYCKVENGTPINVSTPYSSNESPNVANHPPQSQYVPYSRELCGNNSHYGYDCHPQVPFVYNQDPCFNQNFDYFPQTSPSFPQQYLCCENCGGPHETYQCQPMNEDYYHEQNSCYDSNSFGFDQVQPPQYTVNHPIFNSQNDLLNSQNKLMEQMTTLRDLVGQAIQKKEEEKRIAEEQAAKDRSWKIPICYDDDEDNTIAITPVSPIEEPDNSLSMGDEHLDTIPATESDEVIKSSVENLIPIPSEPEGIPDSMCDVPLCNNPTSLNTLNEHSEIVVNSNDDNSSSDDDSTYGEDIDYVDASLPDVEIVSLEVVEIVDPEVGRIDDDILLTIKDDILREKLLNVNLLIAKIDSLRDNPTPSSEVVIKSTSTFPNLFLEETNTFDNSIPESETFRFNLEEISSGSPTTHSELSLPDYKAFYVDTMFLWAKAVSTACYTQNRSLIHTRYNKTPYELVHEKKPDLTFFQVFGAPCYPTNDSKDLGKFQAKADIGIFVGLAPTDKELEMLFQPMFDEHLEQSRVNKPVPSATEINAQVVPLGTSLSTTIAQDAPSTSASSSTSGIHPPVQHQEISEDPIHEDTPINHDFLHPSHNLVTGDPGLAQSSSGNVNSAKPNQVNYPSDHLRRWTKDHPLDNIVGNPSRPVSTRKQLASDAFT
ncbi:putative reverse transcriptase domain-containing protein [Tanacetum coccineum]